ncbi:MAG TPA: glycosyltransferase [Thermoleophilaceae bacterium]|nr:glycosyltransferase [Thermoleophilaceae bacterium]
MARILAYTSPARGHLFPVTPVLLELHRRGHQVSVRTLASQAETMRGLGLDAEAIDPAIEAIEHDDYLARTPIGANKRAVRTFCRRAAHEVPDLRRAIEARRPDALLVDVNTFGAQAVADDWNGPWAVWCPYPIPIPSRDAPPFGPGLRPARGVLGRLRDAALRPLVFGSLERIVVPGVNEVRARVGLQPLSSAKAMFTAPPLLIYMTAEPFEYPRSDWPQNLRMVGPCDWDPPADPPGWLADVDDPIVLVTTSSEFQDDGRLARCALEALADERVHVVVTAPSVDLDGAEVPPNGRVVSFASHSALLTRAACAITHGGMGATQKALAHGVPVCTVPFARDQLEVARRVEVAGAGTRLPARGLDPRRLRAKVHEAIARRQGAQRVAQAYKAAGGPMAAADATEQLLLHEPEAGGRRNRGHAGSPAR